MFLHVFNHWIWGFPLNFPNKTNLLELRDSATGTFIPTFFSDGSSCEVPPWWLILRVGIAQDMTTTGFGSPSPSRRCVKDVIGICWVNIVGHVSKCQSVKHFQGPTYFSNLWYRWSKLLGTQFWQTPKWSNFIPSDPPSILRRLTVMKSELGQSLLRAGYRCTQAGFQSSWLD